MFGGINPTQIQGMMKKMGIKQQEIDALRVIIEKTDGGRIVIDNPSVSKIDMQGNTTWQISGNAREESGDISEADIKSVMDSANCSHDAAKKALEASGGDLAEAILSLS
jgi:nascent polypeptide-associated complex subunit alpha